MGPKDNPFGGATGSARQPAPESMTEGNVFEQALGGSIVDLIAQKLGLSPEQAKGTLAQLVPAITSRMAAEERLTGEP